MKKGRSRNWTEEEFRDYMKGWGKPPGEAKDRVKIGKVPAIMHKFKAKPQDVDFEEADRVNTLHIVLTGDFPFVGAVERDMVDERRRRDDYTGCVRGSVAGNPLQRQAEFHQPLVLGITADERLELGDF